MAMPPHQPALEQLKPESRKLPDGRIPPSLVVDTGRTLFGAYWQRSFAQALKVTERTLYRWSNDGCPASSATLLRGIIRQRQAEMERLERELLEFE